MLPWNPIDGKESVIPLAPSQQVALERFHQKMAQGVYRFTEVPCLCGAADGKLVARRDRYGLSVDTYLCRHCAVLYTSPRMTTESLERFYCEDYRPLYTARSPARWFNDQAQHGEAIRRFATPFVLREVTARPVVFDIGCGAGGTLAPFATAGWAAYGCDFGPDRLEYGKGMGLMLKEGGPEALAQYAPANLIILSHVVEHVPNPHQMLRELTCFIDYGGYFYVEVPGVLTIHRNKGSLRRYLQNAHLYHFTLGSLSTLMAQAGFHLVKGDESVRALFRYWPNVPRRQQRRPSYAEVLTYLSLLPVLSAAYGTARTAKRLLW